MLDEFFDTFRCLAVLSRHLEFLYEKFRDFATETLGRVGAVPQNRTGRTKYHNQCDEYVIHNHSTNYCTLVAEITVPVKNNRSKL